ncbi:hypothetical protein MYCTH_2306674 [Thermothelomyces thermophilus ATCC 42464]|uniref:YTH domain-containing protein n=1 Tax=Thermothelomyces thermophilus (strain ATCC 42464 / BCRC 31852 / DSM 1799) TaxID=573729 RepID=G2QHR3_THET4|nr:uncharacterized protein MYCTH_2306674 [Thermothelomyces thermophilus ATCC 42464]AEO58923.1 hypothetical protein MYCTH_2306674 [Thermothelomyces thermophilus ATCC 42464]
MTDYYNVEARTRRLARFRRAKALAAEKRRIEEEERKLKEEEELEMELQRSTVARLTSAVPSAFSASDSNTLPTPVTPITKSVNEGEGRDTSRVIPVKRELEPETSPEARQEKVPRLEAPPSTRSRDLEDRTREDDKRDELYSRRELSPRHQDRHDQSPLPRPHYRDDNNGEDNRRVDRYRGEDSRYRESERRSSYPIHVDLGRKGDTRFFILKSFNEENVRRCMEDCLWTTQIPNAEVLSKAFAECKNVILFFSVNKSKAFQGYARMMSAPSPDNPRPSFAKGIHWETSDPFRVRWLSKTAVDFWRIGHIKNPYNDYLPVLVGKDGQEIEEECGAALLREMEGYAAAAESSRSYGGGKRPAVESYHLGRRESGGGRFYVDRYRG